MPRNDPLRARLQTSQRRLELAPRGYRRGRIFALARLLVLFTSAQALDAQEWPEAISGTGRPTIEIPRLDAAVTIDGALDEPAWARAVRLSGFSQYQPVDGRAAEEQTDVLVWYSPDALHFGIVAYDRDPSTLRATVAHRDDLDQEDSVTIYLDTFNDRRRAFFFTVNPLGAQQDGVHSEGSGAAGTLFGGNIDKSPDYKFDSKGSVTDSGYIVELRIPFKSLRYPGSGPQTWGINIKRKIQRTGYEDTWTDVRRASASFLAQSGTITGLHDMRRGVVTEVQPVVTSDASGQRLAAGGRFLRAAVELDPSVNVRVGLPNVAIDATINPDFSQVETDAGLVTTNERFALFVPEKRPFFLEGVELFSTPNQLVYTRRIVAPIAGGKFTGKLGPLGVAYLTAVDDTASGNVAVNIARLRVDFGANSLAGVTYTDRTGPGEFNRVLAADSRMVFKRLYFVEGQVGRSFNAGGGPTEGSPIWHAAFDRTGRQWGFNYRVLGVGETFSAQSGFVPRNNIVDAHAFNRLSFYGGRGAPFENLTMFFGPTRVWSYGDFLKRAAIEGNEMLRANLQMRGGWQAGAQLRRSFVRFERAAYRSYTILSESGVPVPFDPPADLSGSFGTLLSVTTPIFRTVNAKVEVQRAEVPIFPEAAEGRETRAVTSASVRPTSSIRIEWSHTYSRITRARDDSEFARTIIPRVRVDVQPRRSLFFRTIAEYRAERQSVLVDPRSGAPLFVDGVASGLDFNGLRVDWLFSYEPTPGTAVLVGYGTSLEAPEALRQLERTDDRVFVKLAYLFRR
jgi:Domain of unknown function (DUF5916)